MLIDLDAPPAVVRYTESRARWLLRRYWAEIGLSIAMATAVAVLAVVQLAPTERPVTFRWSGGTGFAVAVGSRRVADIPSGSTLRIPAGSYLGVYVVATKADVPATCVLTIAGLPPITATARGLGAVASCEWRVS